MFDLSEGYDYSGIFNALDFMFGVTGTLPLLERTVAFFNGEYAYYSYEIDWFN